MNRQEYMKELEQYLHDVKETEREEALRYCEEYFEEAGTDHEQQAIDELGKPAKFAAQLKAESAIRSAEESNEIKRERPLHNIWKIFMGILALPIALPLMFAVVMLMFAFFLVIFSLIIAGICISAACLLSFIVFIVSLFAFPFSASSLVRVGGALLMLGMGLLLGMGMLQAARIVISWFTTIAAHLYNKAKRGKQNEI